MSILSVSVWPSLSVTLSRIEIIVSLPCFISGIVKDGFTVLGQVSFTVSRSFIFVKRYCKMSPSGSLLEPPSKATVSPPSFLPDPGLRYLSWVGLEVGCSSLCYYYSFMNNLAMRESCNKGMGITILQDPCMNHVLKLLVIARYGHANKS